MTSTESADSKENSPPQPNFALTPIVNGEMNLELMITEEINEKGRYHF